MKVLIKRALDYFWLDVKLKYKFFIIYFICTIIPFSLLAIISSNSLSNRTKAIILDSVTATKEHTIELLRYQLGKVISITESIYLDTELYDYLSSFEITSSMYSMDVIEQKLKTLSSEKDILSVQLYIVNERKVTMQNFRCLGVSAAKHTKWYSEIINSEKNSIWLLNKQTNIVYYVRKMFSTNDRHLLIGYIAIASSKESINHILKNLIYTDNSIVLISENDSIIYDIGNENSETPLENFSVIQRDIKRKSENTINGIKYWTVGEYIPKYTISSMPKWNIILLAPYEELFFSPQTIMTAITYTALICIIIFNFIAALFIGHITKRIEKVSDNIKLLQIGNFTSNDISVGRDEISMLRHDFNRMLDRTKMLIKQTILAHEQAKDLELYVLQGQINPHFLYNTLDLINWLVISTNSSREISEITNLLARFYKLSLKNGVRIVRVADELEHIHLYVELQNKLHENAITLHINVQGNHLECACIKILLQPIVENAILHGIMERDIIEGNIWIYSVLDQNDLIISVRDDGIGIDPDAVDILNQRNNWMKEKGYGIKNTRDRIHLCYGYKYGIQYESKLGEGTTVYVRIPYIQYSEEMRDKRRLG